MQLFSIAIHGGAGTILKSEMTEALEKTYHKGLQEALYAGYAVLQKGGSSVDAVKTAVIHLEDNILFNAGRGSVFTYKGMHEMDASVMDGKTLDAGAVAGVSNIRNPVELAYEIMQYSGHVFLSGADAKEFAIKRGIRMENDDYFFSRYRYDQWVAMRDSGGYALDHSLPDSKEKKFGTVGAVACDAYGNVAAATSTGGMTNKKYGRIGDTPLIGAGTYANNKTCAVSCTGHGELFIKAVAAYDVSCLMEYRGMTLQEAVEEVTMKKLVSIGGEGGMIGADAHGNTVMVLNSEGMYRAMKNSRGEEVIAVYKD
jgi:L-asparaginase / beta-aspartyl-peptidase